MGSAPYFKAQTVGGPTFVISIICESTPRFTYAVVAFNVVYSV